MKNQILFIVFSILLLNCNGQDKDVKIDKRKEEVGHINTTFVGVIKTDNLYTVYDRCDGGYPILRFKKGEFYFYDPQEGANYIIKEIKNKDDNFVIYTDGYYFLKGEKILKQNDIWLLEKQNNLLWTFKNKKWDKTVLLSDSLNIIKKKIVYKVQKNNECLDDNDILTDNNLIGNWTTNCASQQGISIKENEIVITVDPNQYYIHLTKIADETKKNFFRYKLKGFDGIGSKDVSSESYFNDNEVANVKILSKNKIEFYWLGFYNKVNKERQYTESTISNENPTILVRCDE